MFKIDLESHNENSKGKIFWKIYFLSISILFQAKSCNHPDFSSPAPVDAYVHGQSLCKDLPEWMGGQKNVNCWQSAFAYFQQ